MPTIITNVYVGSPTIALASASVEQNIQLPQRGDESALMTLLADLGVSAEEVEALRTALHADAQEGAAEAGLPGPQVSRWMARVLTRSAIAGGHLGTAAAGNLIALALAAYLGIG